ncbi:hypothetical protein V7S43_015593 [Phytophthora oleae]|uniref:Uncharacterized protein n=1 Tax=Phytophthora oleae TaxID=2107226 RepID=A0ABD3EYI7_9STRA
MSSVVQQEHLNKTRPETLECPVCNHRFPLDRMYLPDDSDDAQSVEENVTPPQAADGFAEYHASDYASSDEPSEEEFQLDEELGR